MIKLNQKTIIEELLNGLNMGMVSIDHLLDKIENEKLRNIVMHQRKSYGELKDDIIHAYPDVIDKTKQKLMLEGMVEMKSIIADDAKIAKMLIEGCNQAMINMTHLENESDISSEIEDYMTKFESINKHYVEELKAFI
ncbi:MAG: hypothetical protein LUG60_08340 [Erysipelotrichaceae bacterium]|nr:hypothetical protein [Erysipelotrichaceae bacterium]